jgi:hypothetical protein
MTTIFVKNGDGFRPLEAIVSKNPWNVGADITLRAGNSIVLHLRMNKTDVRKLLADLAT